MDTEKSMCAQCGASEEIADLYFVWRGKKSVLVCTESIACGLRAELRALRAPTLAELHDRGVRLHDFGDMPANFRLANFYLAALTCGDTDGDGNIRVYAVFEPVKKTR